MSYYGVATKPGLSTLDCGLDCGLDYGLDYGPDIRIFIIIMM